MTTPGPYEAAGVPTHTDQAPHPRTRGKGGRGIGQVHPRLPHPATRHHTQAARATFLAASAQFIISGNWKT